MVEQLPKLPEKRIGEMGGKNLRGTAGAVPSPYELFHQRPTPFIPNTEAPRVTERESLPAQSWGRLDMYRLLLAAQEDDYLRDIPAGKPRREALPVEGLHKCSSASRKQVRLGRVIRGREGFSCDICSEVQS